MTPEVLVGPERITVRYPRAGCELASEQESRWLVAARWTLLGALFAAPLAFGAVQPWAWGGLGVIVAVVLVLWSAGAIRESTAAIPWTPLYLPIVGLWVLGLIQYLAYTTVDPIATREALVKGGIYLAILLASGALFCIAPRPAWRRFGIAVTIYTFALALFSILQFFSSPDKIYGVVVPREGGYIFGPYVNHNHYAGLLEFLIPIVAVCWLKLPQWRIANGSVFLIAFVSVIMSGSRAGATAVALEMAVLAAGLLFSSRENRNRTVIGATSAAALILVGVIWLLPAEAQTRYAALAQSPEESLANRLEMSRDALCLAAAHPWLGIGLGGVETAYPAVQSYATDDVIDHVHDDYVELLSETGIAGGLLALLALGLIVAQIARAFRRVHRPSSSFRDWVAAAAALGLCGLLLHSFFDFNLHIPANAAWATLALALASPQAERVA